MRQLRFPAPVPPLNGLAFRCPPAPVNDAGEIAALKTALAEAEARAALAEALASERVARIEDLRRTENGRVTAVQM